jgi:hypothetical protein
MPYISSRWHAQQACSRSSGARARGGRRRRRRRGGAAAGGPPPPPVNKVRTSPNTMLPWMLFHAAMLVGASAQPPLGNATALFVDGNRDETNRSWACVRGAALVRAPNGSLLAFAGGGTSCADGHVGWGILARISPDNGSSWGPIRTIASDAHTTGGYAGPTVDRKRGRVLLLYNRRFVETWQVTSTDSGGSWSTPVNITSRVGVLAIGPPGGVQLPSSGRLVQAVHGAHGTAALYSDDGASVLSRAIGAALSSGGNPPVCASLPV